VGVTSLSHKVIGNLLREVTQAASACGINVACAQLTPDEAPPGIEKITKNDVALARLSDRRANVVGGTSWLWADPRARNSVDVLFVDEAGQMPLANALAASQAGDSVVLLGDPQQLDQPQQGSHPEGADVSALQHMLGDHKTIPSHSGIFLSETWRLAPNICKFTSEVFYEGRLYPHAGLERQVLIGTAPFEGAGLWVNAVLHEGNRNSSIEEVDAVDRIVSSLLRHGAQWRDRDGTARPLTADAVLVVAPYISQVPRCSRSGSHRKVFVLARLIGSRAKRPLWSSIRSQPRFLRMHRT
jgi:uncharacterized protein